jgi:hypothetical protein
MSDHLDYIRIKNLEDADTEVFQGIASSISGGGGGIPLPPPVEQPISIPQPYTPPIEPTAPGEKPVTQAEKKAFDLKSAWAAQQRLINTLINYLSSLSPGDNTDARGIVSDYIALLEATKAFSPSLDAFSINREALSELHLIWDTLDRQPSVEEIEWSRNLITIGDTLETWVCNAIDAHTSTLVARAALDEATTPEAQAAAQTTLGLAEADETRISSDLPAVIIPNLPDLVKGIIAVFAGNWSLALGVLVRIVVKIGVSAIIRFLKRKLMLPPPGENIDKTDIKKIISALEDIALKDAVIKYGDNAEFHAKGQLLLY